MTNYKPHCSACGKFIKARVYPNGMCQGCYKYFLNGGLINPLPPLGVIEKDYRGYPICHICGRAYKRLGSHVKESHQMTISEYKEKFELCSSSKTTEANYQRVMQKYADYYHMADRLIKVGKNTRIKPGENSLRYGKKTRLQETLMKKARRYK